MFFLISRNAVPISAASEEDELPLDESDELI